MRKRTREFDEFNGLGIMTEPTGTRYYSAPTITTAPKTTVVQPTPAPAPAPSPALVAAAQGATKAVTGTTVVQPTPAPTPGVPTYYPPTPISAARQAEIDAFNAKAYSDALAKTNAAGTTTPVQSPALVAAAQGATQVISPKTTPTPAPAPAPAPEAAATPIPAATSPTETVIVTPTQTPAASTPATEAAKTDATVIVTEPSLGPTKSPPDVRTDGTNLDSEAVDTSYAYDTYVEEDPDAYEAVYDEGTTDVQTAVDLSPILGTESNRIVTNADGTQQVQTTRSQPDFLAGLQKWWADLWKPIFGGK